MGSKPKQLDTGLAKQPKYAKIEEAAEAYVDVRDRRMALTVKEKEKKTILLALMHENKLTTYKYDGKTVEVQPSEKVKVKSDKDADGKEDDANE